jgi:uncharacterized protein
MKLIVISDTHVSFFRELSPVLQKTLDSADLIIHTGDFVGVDVLQELRKIAVVKAVKGNMDYFDIRHELPEQDTFEVQGKTIGIIHGWGSPFGLEEKIRSRFGRVDLIIYGHTHQSKDEIIDGIRFFNSGSARKTYGVIDIDTTIQSRIVAI